MAEVRQLPGRHSPGGRLPWDDRRLCGDVPGLKENNVAWEGGDTSSSESLDVVSGRWVVSGH